MNLQAEFLSLSAEKKRLVQFELCAKALGVLNAYLAETGEIRYVESIAGTRQLVDPKLPSNAFESAQKGENLFDAENRFAEPITALHYEDLEFPSYIEFAFYSIYNLFQKYVLNRKIDDWLIVNQALSAETDQGKWTELLKNAIEKYR